MIKKMGGKDREIITRQPTDKDPLEVRIRCVLESTLVTSDWARATFLEATRQQKEFLIAAAKEENSRKNLDAYRKLIRELASLLKVQITSGGQELEKFDQGKPFIVITNHLGLAKITRVDNKNRKIAVELEEVESFPIRHAAISVISGRQAKNLHEVAVELPGKLREIQADCEVVTIPVEGSGRTELLVEKVADLVKADPNQLFVMYPEGGTSGKRNSGGPYDLDQFHKGAFVVAAKLSIPILPVCQYFDPNVGLRIYILDPITLNEGDLERVDDIVNSTKDRMQITLNEALSSNA